MEEYTDEETLILHEYDDFDSLNRIFTVNQLITNTRDVQTNLEADTIEFNVDEQSDINVDINSEILDSNKYTVTEAQKIVNNLPINFGFHRLDYDWYLLRFLSIDTLSRINLHWYYIDILAPILNWDILSSKELPGPIIVKHKDKINWEVFLKNGKPKEINYLTKVYDVLEKYCYIFFDGRIKKMYYNKHFLLVFPQFVDWDWCAKNLTLSPYILEKYWDKFNKRLVSKYQILTSKLAICKKSSIIWDLASKKSMAEDMIHDLRHYVNWKVICKKQKLSCGFMKNHKVFLDWEMVSRYQNMDIDFITENLEHLKLELLSINKHFNKKDTIHVIENNKIWFIIQPPIIDSYKKVNFLSACIEL
jgi:hypothetical protein